MDFRALEPRLMQLGQALRDRGWRMAAAESCTGGLLAAACTAVPGSSDWFDRGFVTYSNEAKHTLLGVDPTTLEEHGAVSEPVARAMVAGALSRSRAQVAVAVTGIAGPGGAVPGKPVGTVWLAWGGTEGPIHARRLQLGGDRTAVREATVDQALAAVQSLLDQKPPRAATASA